MVVLQFLIVAAFSAADPIAIVLYGIAAYFTRTWRAAAGAGVLAGVAVVAITLVLASANGRQPKQFNLLAQVCACVFGAAAVRGAINGLKRAPAAL
jgi:hypothetical protein